MKEERSDLWVGSGAQEFSQFEVIDGELFLWRPKGNAIGPLHRLAPSPSDRLLLLLLQPELRLEIPLHLFLNATADGRHQLSTHPLFSGRATMARHELRGRRAVNENPRIISLARLCQLLRWSKGGKARALPATAAALNRIFRRPRGGDYRFKIPTFARGLAKDCRFSIVVGLQTGIDRGRNCGDGRENREGGGGVPTHMATGGWNILG